LRRRRRGLSLRLAEAAFPLQRGLHLGLHFRCVLLHLLRLRLRQLEPPSLALWQLWQPAQRRGVPTDRVDQERVEHLRCAGLPLELSGHRDSLDQRQ
jgi:hypothetical protein